MVRSSLAVQRLETPYGDLLIHDLRLFTDRLEVHGSVTNRSDRAWRWLSFLLRMHEASGRLIPHDDGLDGCFYVKGLGKGETGQITDRKGQPARLFFKPATHPASVLAEFIPERSYFDSRYSFSLVSPQWASSPVFQDERLSVHLIPSHDGLSLQLMNRSSQTLQIDWERVVYIDLAGKKHRMIHQGVDLKKKDSKQAPTSLIPGASLKNRLYPADMVAGSRLFEDWRLNPFLPLSQDAPHFKWRTFSLILPLQFGTDSRAYEFGVRIEAVIV